jgi:hypothetical protein
LGLILALHLLRSRALWGGRTGLRKAIAEQENHDQPGTRRL